MVNEDEKQFNDLVQNIGRIASSFNGLARQACVVYAGHVNEIVETQSLDTNRIEHLLDGMLGFCFDPEMLQLFKKLCRYYHKIDPQATASHVLAYREMWDDGTEERQ